MKPKVVLVGIVCNLVLILAVVNGSIHRKEKIVEDGTTVFLGLAPRDPRSLIQGDYMVLRQSVLRESEDRHAMENAPTRGRLVLQLDERGIGTFARPDDGSGLRENEVFLKYRRSKRRYHYGLESFFFQEGDAESYAGAEFCETKIDGRGNAVLVDLRGTDLAEIK